jgi:hypothetical protein
MRRAIWARLLNLVVPGSGMILLRREWLGFVAAILFSLLAALAIVGRWVVPRDVPPLLVAVSGWAAVGVWGLTQWLVHRRARWLASPALARELAVMRAQAAEALAEGDHMEAHRVLLVARSVDDEDVELAVLWAELMTAMGRQRAARRGWQRVRRLDRSGAKDIGVHDSVV